MPSKRILQVFIIAFNTIREKTRNSGELRCVLQAVAAPLLLASLCVSAQQGPPTAELSIKPKLCVRGTSADQCELEVKISWHGNETGEYCLYSDFSGTPLRCWESDVSGQLHDQVSITADLNYWLAWQPTDDELARRTLKVLTAKSDDRRRSRRRRHVWSVF